jgi:hypothetical protein
LHSTTARARNQSRVRTSASSLEFVRAQSATGVPRGVLALAPRAFGHEGHERLGHKAHEGHEGKNAKSFVIFVSFEADLRVLRGYS